MEETGQKSCSKIQEWEIINQMRLLELYQILDDVLKSIMQGNDCWQSDLDTDMNYETGTGTFYQICYMGDVGWTQREWETII